MSYLFSDIIEHLLYIEKLQDNYFVYVDENCNVSIKNHLPLEYFTKTGLIVIINLYKYLENIHNRELCNDDFKGYIYRYSRYQRTIDTVEDIILAKNSIRERINNVSNENDMESVRRVIYRRIYQESQQNKVITYQNYRKRKDDDSIKKNNSIMYMPIFAAVLF